MQRANLGRASVAVRQLALASAGAGLDPGALLWRYGQCGWWVGRMCGGVTEDRQAFGEGGMRVYISAFGCVRASVIGRSIGYPRIGYARNGKVQTVDHQLNAKLRGVIGL